MRLSNIIRPLILGGGSSDGVAAAVVLEVGTDVSVLLLLLVIRGIRVATGSGNNTCRLMALIVVAIHTIRATMGAASWNRKIPAVPDNSDEVVVVDAAAAAANVLLLPAPIVVVLKVSAAIPDELDDDDEYMLVVE